MSVDKLVGTWREVRSGLIDEAEQVPSDQFSFRATQETRSVTETWRPARPAVGRSRDTVLSDVNRPT